MLRRFRSRNRDWTVEEDATILLLEAHRIWSSVPDNIYLELVIGFLQHRSTVQTVRKRRDAFLSMFKWSSASGDDDDQDEEESIEEG